MKMLTKTVLLVVSLLLSATLVFAADIKVAAPDAKGTVKSAGDSAKEKTAEGKAPVKAKLIDINTATVAELKAVPGIGDAYAAKIIVGRPYANKTQLKSRNILPGNVYEQVKELLIAKLVKK